MFGGARPAGRASSSHSYSWPSTRRLGRSPLSVQVEDGPDGAARVDHSCRRHRARRPLDGRPIDDRRRRTLFGRFDLELILSSPSTRAVSLLCAAFSIAIDSSASVVSWWRRSRRRRSAAWPSPLARALPRPDRGRSHGDRLGVILALGLFFAVGPRRARLFSRTAATMVRASFVLGAQAVAMPPDRMRAGVLAIFAPPVRSAESALQNLLWAPVRAAARAVRGMLIWAASASPSSHSPVLFGERSRRRR